MMSVGGDLSRSVFSFIPNTAEVAFIGMIEGMEEILEREKADEILRLSSDGALTPDALRHSHIARTVHYQRATRIQLTHLDPLHIEHSLDLEREKADEILRLSSDGALTPDALRAVMARKLRVEKVAFT